MAANGLLLRPLKGSALPLKELEKTELSLKEKDPTPAGLVETEQMLEKTSVEKSQACEAGDFASKEGVGCVW